MAHINHTATKSNASVEQLRRLLADKRLRDEAQRLLATEGNYTLLSTKAAAAYLKGRWGLKRSIRTLQQMRRDGDGPSYRRAGNDVLYTSAAIDRWVRERFDDEVRSTAEEAARRLLVQATATART